eukprot:1902756-Amphidinium_carterae.1
MQTSSPASAIIDSNKSFSAEMFCRNDVATAPGTLVAPRTSTISGGVGSAATCSRHLFEGLSAPLRFFAMCKHATLVLQSHIVVVSVLLVTLFLATVGYWFEYEADDAIACEYDYELVNNAWERYTVEDSCKVTHLLTMYSVSGAHVHSWEDVCEKDNEALVCGMWRPSLTLHVVAFILVICALSTASAHACGCCCVGSPPRTKTTL